MHYLCGKHFKIVTDQQAVSFMFDVNHSSKIKNEKIQRWRLQLSSFSFDIVYRPGFDNVPPDTFSNIGCSSMVLSRSTAVRVGRALLN